MARIPTLITRETLQTGGGTGPQGAPLDAFGPTGEGLSQLARGVGMLGQGMGNLAEKDIQAKQLRQIRDEHKWVSEQATNFELEFDEWRAKHQNDLDIHSKLIDYAGELKSKYVVGAPSQQAGQELSFYLDRKVTSGAERAVFQQENNRIDDTIASVVRQRDAAFESFQIQRSMGEDGIEDLQVQTERIRNTIVASFPGSPATVRKLSEDLSWQTANMLILADLDAAERYVTSAPDLDPDKRATLARRIDMERREGLKLAQTMFEIDIEKQIKAAADGAPGAGTIPEEKYVALYGSDEGRARKAIDDIKIETGLRFNSIRKGIEGYNALEARKAIDDINANQRDIATQRAIPALEEWYSDYVKEMTVDPAGFLAKYNPAIKSASERYSYSRDPFDMKEVVVLTKKYQGYPPPDADPEEAKRYLGRPSGDVHILSAGQATEIARMVTDGSIREGMDRMRAVTADFDEADKDKAIDDLSTLPPEGKRMPQEFVVAWINRDDPEIYIPLLTAIDNTRKIRDGIPDDVVKDVDKSMMSSIQLSAVWKAMNKSDIANMGAVSGYRNAIKSYAMWLASPENPRQLEPDAAVEQASQLFFRNYGVSVVDGVNVLIPKKRGPVSPGAQPKQPRSDAEVLDMGRKLDWAKVNLDPRTIDPSNWNLRLKGLPDTDPYKWDEIYQTINRTGYFIPTYSGQGMQLVVDDANGNPVAVRDKKGNVLTVMLDDLPDFTESRAIVTYGMSATTATREEKMPAPTRSLLQGRKNVVTPGFTIDRVPEGLGVPKGYAPPSYSTVEITNWPITGSYWQFVSPTDTTK